MQPLTAAPRDFLTSAQVAALLVAPDLEVDFGVELLDAGLRVIDDLSGDVAGAIVHHDNLADVHSTLDLTISRELVWGKDRVRPFMVLGSSSAGVAGCRWDLGVYLVTSPDTVLGESPPSYAAVGYDLLTLLMNPIGDSYSVPAGANVLGAVRAAIAAAGVTTPVLLDSTGSAKVTATARVWVQDSSLSPTYLGVINDLLGSIGYRGIWADWAGCFRSGPYVLPSARQSEFLLSVGDLDTGIVADRSVSQDLWQIPNWMRVIRNDMPTMPVEGNGRVTLQNPSTGPSSQAAVGRLVKAPVTYVDATSQGDLVTQANRLFAAAMRVPEILTLKMSPMPAAWQADRYTYSDPDLGADREVLGRSWDLPLDGADMQMVVETV